jgi:hypothetical protein
MSIELLQELVRILSSVLEQPDRRKQLIKEFQQRVWDSSESGPESRELETLRDLAYDLDFYEPDISIRAEDGSYYGDERAEEEIRSALERLTKGPASGPLKE